MLSCFSIACLRATAQTPLVGSRWMSSALFDDLVKQLNLSNRIGDFDQLQKEALNPNSELSRRAESLFQAASAEEQARFLQELEEGATSPATAAQSGGPGGQVDLLEAWINRASSSSPELAATTEAAAQALSGLKGEVDEADLDKVFEEEKLKYLEALKASKLGANGLEIADDQTLGMLERFFLNMKREDVNNPNKAFEAAVRDIGASEEMFEQLSKFTGVSRDDLIKGSADPKTLFDKVGMGNLGDAVRRTSETISQADLLSGNFQQAQYLLRNSSSTNRARILATYTPNGEQQEVSLRLQDAAMAPLFNLWSDDELQAFLLLRMEFQKVRPSDELFRELDATQRGRSDEIATTIQAFKVWFVTAAKADNQTSSRVVEGMTIDDYDELKQTFNLDHSSFTEEQAKTGAQAFAAKKLRAEYTEEQIKTALEFSQHPAFARLAETGIDGNSLSQMAAMFGDEEINELTKKFENMDLQLNEQELLQLQKEIGKMNVAADAMRGGIMDADLTEVPKDLSRPF